MSYSGSSSRAQRPPPLDINKARAFTTPYGRTSASSGSSEKSSRSYSSDFASRPEFSSHNRTGSKGSMSSTSSHASSPKKHSATSPNKNVYTTCGRHSNQWLFSGWSFKKQ